SRAVDIEEKSVRVRNFHDATVEAFLELCGAMGLEDPDDLTPADLLRRSGDGTKSFRQLYAPLEPEQLLSTDIPLGYSEDWSRASASSF
ncbi:MAG: FMN-binding glutamate synthase family protein, partial [Pseudomonadales bacterium]|nr:FMN-binding glutamate synthase family protein [Pseudomonadales bacterium]